MKRETDGLRGLAIRFTLTALLSLFAAETALATNAKVCFSGSCPPNNYNRRGDCTNRQPAFDHDLDGVGGNDVWKNSVTVKKSGPGNFASTDACGNCVFLVCIPDPAGPGKGADYFSPRFKKAGEVAGTEIGKCVYRCGRNTWKACFADANRDCVPDKFTKSTWESRNGGTRWRFTGDITTFTTDLTARRIVPVRTHRRVRRGTTAEYFYEITDAVVIDFNTPLETVILDGLPLDIGLDIDPNDPNGPNDPNDPNIPSDIGQEPGDSSQSNVSNDLLLETPSRQPGDVIVGRGQVTNTDNFPHLVTVTFYAVNAQLLHGDREFVLQPGETTSYQMQAVVTELGPGALIAFASTDAGTDGDGELDAVVFDTSCLDGTVNVAHGTAVPVLGVNGSFGDDHRVSVPVGCPITVSVDASPSGPAPADCVIYAWRAEASEQGGHSLFSVGIPIEDCIALPTPLHASGPRPFRCVITQGMDPILCGGVPRISAPFVPFAVTKQSGFSRPITFTLQGIMVDSGAGNTINLSTTNAVILSVE